MILLAFIPGARSTVSMECLRALGATLARDRYPIAFLEHESVKDAIKTGVYRVVYQTDEFFEVEQFRFETREYGKGIDTTGAPANLAMKIMAFPAMARCKINPSDRVVFTVRRAGDTCRSQSERGIFHAQGHHRLNYTRCVWHFEEWAKTAPCPILYLDTDDLVTDPVSALSKLKDFCGLPGDPEIAAKIIDASKVRPPVNDPEDAALGQYRAVRAKCR